MNPTVYTRIVLRNNFITKCRHFSCVSSNGTFHLHSICQKDPNHKPRSYGCSYKIQTCTVTTQPDRGFFSPDNEVFSFTMDMLQKIHDTTGLPWWATIILTTITLRTLVTLPFTILTLKNQAKLENLIPLRINMKKQVMYEISMAMKLKQIQKDQAPLKAADILQDKTRELYQQHNCHPFKSIVVLLVQLPLWISQSVSYRLMCYNNTGWQETSDAYQSLLTEGALWFTNLTVPDPTWILPVTLGLLNLTIGEIQLHSNIKDTKSVLPKILPNVFRVVSLIFIPLAGVLPSAVTLYWVISSSFGLVQAVLFKMPTVRRLVGILKSPSENPTPFKSIWEEKKKFFTRKQKEMDKKSKK